MIVTRKEKIRMSLSEYYLGNQLWTRFLRILGGPVILILGLWLINQEDKFALTYGGFCIGYGIYYIFKPLILIVMRGDFYKSAPLEVAILEDKIRFTSDEGYSELELSAFSHILARKDYFAFRINQRNAIYVPFKVLSDEQREKLNALARN